MSRWPDGRGSFARRSAINATPRGTRRCGPHGHMVQVTWCSPHEEHEEHEEHAGTRTCKHHHNKYGRFLRIVQLHLIRGSLEYLQYFCTKKIRCEIFLSAYLFLLPVSTFLTYRNVFISKWPRVRVRLNTIPVVDLFIHLEKGL